jgi:hypothetical protein
MCELGTIALMATSAALSAAGGMVSSNAMNTQVKQQNEFQRQMMDRNRKMRQDELLRQDALKKEQQKALLEGEKNLTAEARAKQLEKAEGDTIKNVDQITNDVKDATADVAGIIESQSTGNVVAESDYKTRLANAAKDSRKRIQSMAKIGAYELAAGERGMLMDKVAEKINMGNNFRKGSLAVAETGLNLFDNVAKSTVIAPQTNMLAAGQGISGLGQLAGSAASGGLGPKVTGLFV